MNNSNYLLLSTIYATIAIEPMFFHTNQGKAGSEGPTGPPGAVGPRGETGPQGKKVSDCLLYHSMASPIKVHSLAYILVCELYVCDTS